MKAKHIIIGGIALVILAGAAWLGFAAHRSRHQLVTLHVRNAPIAAVIRKLESQTGQKIGLDRKLEGVITLDIKSKPLGEVLDLVADQIGARWGKTYAVYHNDSAVRRFESVLRGDASLEEAGWTNIAPRSPASALSVNEDGPGKMFMSSPGESGGMASGKGFKSEEDVQRFIQEHMKDGATVTSSGEPGARRIIVTKHSPGGGQEVASSGSAGGDMPPVVRNMTVRRMAGPGGITTTTSDGNGKVRIVKTSADGKILQEDEWSPERLVLEQTLVERLSDAAPVKATSETARDVALKVNGRTVTYYALEKPPIAMPELGGLMRRSGNLNFKFGKTNGPVGTQDIQERMAAEAAQRRLEALTKSPEEQVQRARRMKEANKAN